MNQRPKSAAFLLIALAFLCVYLVKSYYISTPAALSTLEVKHGFPKRAGARLVYGLKVDINSATAKELELLPGIGPVLGARIVEERRVTGRFNTIKELSRVKGLSPKRLEALSPYITVGG